MKNKHETKKSASIMLYMTPVHVLAMEEEALSARSELPTSALRKLT